VKAVCIDLGASTDLDVPAAEMLAELSEELHSREIRCMLMHVITPVRQMLQITGAMQKFEPEDLFADPIEAVLGFLSSQADAAGIEELMRNGASSMVSLMQSGVAAAPEESRPSLEAIVDTLKKGTQ
jgi:hypothetical protein